MRRIALPQGRLLEGPTWNAADGKLSWIDVLDPIISSGGPDGSRYCREPLAGGEPGVAGLPTHRFGG